MGHHHEQKVPRGAVVAAGTLIVFTIAIAASARYARLHAAEPPRASPHAEVELRFEDRPDGSVGVLGAQDAREVAVLAPGTNGFVRGVLRGMFRTRKLESVDPHEPFRLSHEADGRLVLQDPVTGREIELRSFGRTNYEAFAGLLAAATDEG